MIAFATLFLGLVLGPQQVELLADPDVAAIEIEVAGKSCAHLAAPPWRSTCDLGRRLEPKRLVAVAFGADDREIARAEQLLNVWRSPAEISLLVEPALDSGRRRVRARFSSLVPGEPRTVAVSLDGAPLVVAEPGDFELPTVDERVPHLLRIEADWSDLVNGGAELVFGGTYGSQIASTLTAVPIDAPPRTEPTSEQVAAALSRGGSTPRVAAVERGPGELWVIADPEHVAAIGRVTSAGLPYMLRLSQGATTSTERETPFRRVQGWRFQQVLAAEDKLRVVWPWPEATVAAGLPAEMFRPSPPFSAADGGLPWIVSRAHLAWRGDGPPHLADAVAVAGMALAGLDRRRALLLIVGGNDTDGSRLSPSDVRAFLSSLRVPLRVWRTGRRRTAGADPWGETALIDSPPRLASAMRAFTDELARQRIVWIEGAALPNEIVLAPGSPFGLAGELPALAANAASN